MSQCGRAPMRAYPSRIAMTAAGRGAKLVRGDTSLPGRLFFEAAFLRDHRRKQINGTVNPAAKAAQKSIASTGERNSGVVPSLLRAVLDQGDNGRPWPNTRNMSSFARYHRAVMPVCQGTTRCMA